MNHRCSCIIIVEKIIKLYMYTRSIIQQQIERENIQESFKDGLNSIMDKYTIEDSVFGIVDGRVTEAVSGYFVEEKEYDSIDEAMNDFGKAVRIQNNEKFTTGTIYKSIAKCPKDQKILDLDTLEYVA